MIPAVNGEDYRLMRLNFKWTWDGFKGKGDNDMVWQVNTTMDPVQYFSQAKSHQRTYTVKTSLYGLASANQNPGITSETFIASKLCTTYTYTTLVS